MSVKLTDKEVISMLLYYVEDLKMKVFNGDKFTGFQCPMINSITNIVIEEYAPRMEENEVLKIMISTDSRGLSK